MVMGLDENDARQILMQLVRPHNFNYDGIGDSFESFCAQRNDALNQMFNEHLKPSIKRSPLLSASSIATNQTNVTSKSNGSSKPRRSTLGEEGFFV